MICSQACNASERSQTANTYRNRNVQYSHSRAPARQWRRSRVCCCARPVHFSDRHSLLVIAQFGTGKVVDKRPGIDYSVRPGSVNVEKALQGFTAQSHC